MKKWMVLIAVVATPTLANGPKYNQTNPLLQDEFENVYKDIGNVTKNGIRGVATNTDAAAGMIGEYISASAGATNVTTTNTGQDLLTINLTPGDWDVTGLVRFNMGTATWTQQLLYIATGEPGNSFTNSTNFTTQIADNSSSATTPVRVPITVANVRVSIAVNTVIQLKVRIIFSAGQPTVDGAIVARRVR